MTKVIQVWLEYLFGQGKLNRHFLRDLRAFFSARPRR